MDQKDAGENKTVRAKFLCTRVTKDMGGASSGPVSFTYHFNAVTHSSKENESFWKWTPSGTIDLTAIKDELFEVGREYYLDFTMAPAEVLGLK